MNITPRSTQAPEASSGDGRSARWDAHRQVRRLELISVARRALHRLGPAASMEDLAAAAGTSKSVFYRYFGDKNGLRRAMGEVVIAQMRSKVIDAARRASSEEEGLRAMVGAYLHMAQTSPNVYFFVTSTGRDPLAVPDAAGGAPGEDEEPLHHFFADITAMMGERLHAYIGAGEAHAGGAAAVALWPRASIGMVRAAGETWLRLPEGPEKPSEEELAETITRWLVRGIVRRPTVGTPPASTPTTTPVNDERPPQ
ncbi:MAG: TetR/AcrR family transcriptional regulator [Arthrobacter sp.]|uniref:TetR/AcrR family transcriptional regulator n=1 Tax=Arthrobacter sp. TaxID=1667 RepID=UPI003499F5C4